ncbi:uncharacterized protein LOC123560208 isoform X2 [Mercenaria mercenaria]|uniref:uncharacterized protein LOC123560208 isoform X2 n=1 Tax=Mercenaria mercenaria TaxID=6596 RepID=UPI00234FA2B6|nr:uncharacterized protein LOC123560208 isoform X2 [Mercenaria mercenaria]
MFLDQARRGSYRPSHYGQFTASSTPRKMSSVHSIDGLDSSKVKNFPFSSFKLLGALQIGIGVLCILLGIVDLFLFLYTSSHYENDTLKALTIACVPVWCGLWFIVAGSMGSCMSLQQKTTLTYFKMTFLVLSVLCCILFGPALFGVEVYIVFLRTDGSISAHEWLIPLLIAFFTLNEIVIALITSCICCCCSPLNQAKVRVLYTRHLDEVNEQRPEKYRLDTPEIFTTEHSRLEKTHKHASAHHESHAPVHHGRRESHVTDYDHWDEKQQPVSSRQPRVAMTSDSPPLTHYSRPPTYEGNTAQSYRRMKQLALPGNPDTY